MTDQADIDWKCIEGFVGYGRPDAPVLFIGMEEGLGADEDLIENLRRRSRYTPIIDLWEPRRATADAARSFDPNKIGLQPTWRVMCDLMLRRAGIENPTREQRKAYQAKRLGRAVDGETLMAELLPYPHNKASDWEYARFGRFATREKYERKLLPQRQELLKTYLAHRELVVCYGKASWKHYEQLFPDSVWLDLKPFKVARQGETRIILAPHFSGHQHFSTDEELRAFAAVALSA